MTGGNGHSALLVFTQAPQRVVSLVPSMTDSLFDLGLGDSLVGVTDYCQPPASAMSRLERVGGPLTPYVERIRALQPDIVLANQEENPRAVVESLERHGIKVWVTFPRTVRDATGVLWAIAGLFRAPHTRPLLEALEVSVEWAARASAGRTPTRVFCPIWADESPDAGLWWMTPNGQTYMSDVMAICGGANVFAHRARSYPLEADLGLQEAEPPCDRDTRYPRVRPADVLYAQPDVILLPSEPFTFSAKQIDRVKVELAETPAVRTGRVHAIDGRLLTWHGTRLGRALAELPSLLAAPAG